MQIANQCHGNGKRKFQGMKVPGSEYSWERKFLGHFDPRSESSRERKGQGANGPWRTRAREQKFQIANWQGCYWPIRSRERSGPGAKKLWITLAAIPCTVLAVTYKKKIRRTPKRDLKQETWTVGFMNSWRKMEAAAPERVGRGGVDYAPLRVARVRRCK